jgi:trehalose 2-sulfotransferase
MRWPKGVWQMTARPSRSYLLVGAPRTGTSLLSEALASTGVLGRPEEYFSQRRMPHWAAVFGIDPVDGSDRRRYVEEAVRHGTTSNGVFGAKLFFRHAEDLWAWTATDEQLSSMAEPQRLRALFGEDLHAVHVRRHPLRAAVSLWRAESTDIWRAEAGDPMPAPPPRLDVWRVTMLHAQSHAADAAWPQLLRSADIPFITATYERIVNDLEGTVADVAELVGIRDIPSITHPSLRRMGDEASERFLAEWTKATGGCVACDR